MRIVGHLLAEQLRRPMEHLRAEESTGARAPDLMVDLWDESQTGVRCPIDEASDALPRSWRVPDGEFRTSLDGRFVQFQGPGSLTWLDRATRHIVGWRATGARLAVAERSKPLSLLLSIWYASWDIQVVHAGAVARDAAGVLIGGPTGAGKSTTALTCLCAGMGYLGDDQVGVQEMDEGTFMAHSLYVSCRLERDHLRRWPALVPYASLENDDKDLVFLNEPFPAALVPSAPIQAVVLPRIVDRDQPRLLPAAKGEALLRLALSSLLMGLGSGAPGLGRLARLLEQLPTYWLELGRDLTGIPAQIDHLLSGAIHDDRAAR